MTLPTLSDVAAVADITDDTLRTVITDLAAGSGFPIVQGIARREWMVTGYRLVATDDPGARRYYVVRVRIVGTTRTEYIAVEVVTGTDGQRPVSMWRAYDYQPASERTRKAAEARAAADHDAQVEARAALGTAAAAITAGTPEPQVPAQRTTSPATAALVRLAAETHALAVRNAWLDGCAAHTDVAAAERRALAAKAAHLALVPAASAVSAA